MTTLFTQITLAGLTFETCYDDETKEYGVSAQSFQKNFGLYDDFTRAFSRGKTLKAAQGADVNQKIFKRRNGRSFKTYIPLKLFSVMTGVLAKEGNKIAMDFMTATYGEVTERRIDVALNSSRPEQLYEDSTRDFFRELARSSYIPSLTSWLQEGQQCAVNYGKEINSIKALWGLPKAAVECYSLEEMQTWVKGIMTYNGLRMEGYSHKRACRQTASILAAQR